MAGVLLLPAALLGSEGCKSLLLSSVLGGWWCVLTCRRVHNKCRLSFQGQISHQLTVNSVWWCWEPRIYLCGQMVP